MMLAIDDTGPGPEKTLVFMHGFPFNQTMWKAQVALARPYFRVLTFDLRGHGQSDVGSGQYAFEQFVDDVFDVLDGKNIRQAGLCGLSMGGYVALRAIERSPERISALILCDTRSEADSNEAKIKRSDTIKTITNQGVVTFTEAFLKTVLTPQTLATKPAIVDQVRQMMASNTPKGMIGSVLAMAGRTDTTESLQRIQVPTLILVGEKDPITPPATAAAMHQRIKGSTMATIPEAAHLSNLENPAVFNLHLEQFLKRII